MTQQQYIIGRKLNILELGKTLGNISEACRRLGVSRQHYYDIKQTIEEEGDGYVLSLPLPFATRDDLDLLRAVCGRVRVPVVAWAPLLAGIIVSTAGWFFFFATLALRIRRNDAFNAVSSTSFMLLPMSSLFYPTGPMPEWLRHAAMANPITWSIDFLRACTLGTRFDATLAMEAGAFLAFSAVMFVLATRSLRNP